METLSHLVVYIKRRICDDASAWFRLSFVRSFLVVVKWWISLTVFSEEEPRVLIFCLIHNPYLVTMSQKLSLIKYYNLVP